AAVRRRWAPSPACRLRAWAGNSAPALRPAPTRLQGRNAAEAPPNAPAGPRLSPAPAERALLLAREPQRPQRAAVNVTRWCVAQRGGQWRQVQQYQRGCLPLLISLLACLRRGHTASKLDASRVGLHLFCSGRTRTMRQIVLAVLVAIGLVTVAKAED